MTIDELDEIQSKPMTDEERERLYYYVDNFGIDYNENAGYEAEDEGW